MPIDPDVLAKIKVLEWRKVALEYAMQKVSKISRYKYFWILVNGRDDFINC